MGGAALPAVRAPLPCGVQGEYKWSGAAAVGTKIFCAPFKASSVLVIDAATEAVRTIPCGVDGEYKWDGIAAVGTTLFCAPFNASSVLAIDAATEGSAHDPVRRRRQ